MAGMLRIGESASAVCTGCADLEIVGDHVVCRHRHGQGCAVAGVDTTSQRGQRDGDGGLPPCRRLVGAGVQHLDVDESRHQEQHGHHEHEPDEADPSLEGAARPGATGPGDRQPGDLRRRSVWDAVGPRCRSRPGGAEGWRAGSGPAVRDAWSGPIRAALNRWLWRALWGPRRPRLRRRATPGTSARAVRVVSGGDAHGVDVAVVVDVAASWTRRPSRARAAVVAGARRRCHRRGRRRHVGSGQRWRNRQRDIGQLDDAPAAPCAAHPRRRRRSEMASRVGRPPVRFGGARSAPARVRVGGRTASPDRWRGVPAPRRRPTGWRPRSRWP